MKRTILSIVDELNAKSKHFDVGGLQDLRVKLHGLKLRPGTALFRGKTVTDGWACHYGGRTELQFNIGFDGSEGKELRHGVAFSFEESQTLPDIAPLRAKAALFNEYLQLNAEEFSHLRMWYWDENDERSEEMLPAPVATELVRKNVFLFMGKKQSIKDVVVTQILRDFDSLLPLYIFVEGGGYAGETQKKTTKAFTFRSGCTFKKLATKLKPSSDPVDVALRHNAMQHKLFSRLAAKYGVKNVGTEIPTDSGTRIDAVVKMSAGYKIYEIKPYQSARACIREALGQLLEYAHWKKEFEALELCVVGPGKIDNDAREYLAQLHQLYQLPISYLHLSL